jgi:hypothetical protein
MTHSLPSILRRLILATTLAVGFGTLWFVVVNVVDMVGGGLFDSWPGSPAWPPRENLAVRADGTPLIASTPRRASITEYRELNGRAASDPENLRLVDPVWMDALPMDTLSRGAELYLFLFPFGWEDRLKLFVDDQHKSLSWFFVHDGKNFGTGYFVGYDRADNRIVGFIGQQGFTSNPVPTGERFPVRLELMGGVPYWSAAKIRLSQGTLLDEGLQPTPIPSHLVYVPARNRLYLVDLSRRTVQIVFESPEMIASFSVPLESPSPDAGQPSRGPIQVVRTSRHLHWLNRQHEVSRTFSIPTESDRAFYAKLYELSNGEAFAEFYWWRIRDGEQNLDARMLYRIAADGTLADRSELILQSGMLKWHKQSTAFRCALAAPVIIPLVDPLMIMYIDQDRSLAAAAGSMFRNSWPSLLGILVVSAFLAAATGRRARAFALPVSEQFVWVIFVFLGGLPGYAGFRLHRRWPLRQDCPRCRACVPWNREVCSACGVAFPSAAVTGTEILCSEN